MRPCRFDDEAGGNNPPLQADEWLSGGLAPTGGRPPPAHGPKPAPNIGSAGGGHVDMELAVVRARRRNTPSGLLGAQTYSWPITAPNPSRVLPGS
jgi:hypothetical protein